MHLYGVVEKWRRMVKSQVNFNGWKDSIVRGWHKGNSTEMPIQLLIYYMYVCAYIYM